MSYNQINLGEEAGKKTNNNFYQLLTLLCYFAFTITY